MHRALLQFARLEALQLDVSHWAGAPPLPGAQRLLASELRTYGAALRTLVERAKHLPNQGDPAKGMDALVDVVRGEGRAADREGRMPLWLFLGSGAVPDALARAEKLRGVAEEWRKVGEGLGLDD